MLEVGIHENVKFSALKNDKGSLVIVATKAQDTENFDLNAVTNESTGDESQQFLQFPFKMAGFEGGKAVDKRSKSLVITDITDLKAVLNFILSLYIPEDDIEWDLYEGTNVTTTNQGTELFNDSTLTAVYNNLSTQFINQLAGVDNPDALFRVVFPRTSKKSHYPKLRTRKLDEFPFAEPMSVPVEESVVKFTPGELAAGLDSSAIVQPTQSAEDKKIPEMDV